MQFTDINFVLVYIVALPLYYLLKASMRKYLLLFLSLAFYAQFGLRDLMLLLAFSLVIYVSGLLMENEHGRIIYRILFFTFAAVLIFSKNTQLLSNILASKGIEIQLQNVLPVGIAFFILQGFSYLADVGNGGVKSEKNPINILLYISFFPSVISGPIQKGEKFLPMVQISRGFDKNLVKRGLIQMIWGYFQKLARALGYDLEKNFNFPYMAKSIKKFWQRWHISLSRWLCDYIYIPLGGNRKGTFRKYVNIVVVFLASGLWHGGGLSFVVWGMLHAFYQIVAEITTDVRKHIRTKLGICENDKAYIWFQRICVFTMVDFAWIFFKAPSLRSALNYLRKMKVIYVSCLVNGELLNYGLNIYHWVVLIVAFFIFLEGQRLRGMRNIYEELCGVAPCFQYISFDNGNYLRWEVGHSA